MSAALLRPPARAASPAPARGSATARLEYRLALDLAFSAVMSRCGPESPVLSIASTRTLCYEAALRSRTIDTVACESAWAVDVPDPGVLRPVADLSEIQSGAAGAVWFSPSRQTWQERLAQVERVLAPGGILAVLTAGSGSSFAALRRDWSDGEPDWDGRDLQRALAQRQYRPCGRLELAGASSVFWVLLQRACSLMGRLDLADRCEVAYRLSIAGELRRILPQFVLTLHQRGAVS
ncbi:MAG: hypothetical protein U0893_08495 [Chloroflexota bacterium]